MYLKTLTLKGFKSFASATTMRLEPGITCVVGPNGSGKSNVVDALAWVMGEQGAKSLRGGKMEDVIFAGTAGRPALGRAEVTLTIDNTDGALPIAYTEVSITRRMYRSGESEYEINGDKVRLLDVQELLSDSGIGREMHVIVGQGQLDQVLRATAEERRGFIEEAAGVLKHRKRKEKALRKLDATDGNLMRLGDLLSEIRRQLKPLGRQAEVARQAQTVQADVRDARARLLADDPAGAGELLGMAGEGPRALVVGDEDDAARQVVHPHAERLRVGEREQSGSALEREGGVPGGPLARQEDDPAGRAFEYVRVQVVELLVGSAVDPHRRAPAAASRTGRTCCSPSRASWSLMTTATTPKPSQAAWSATCSVLTSCGTARRGSQATRLATTLSCLTSCCRAAAGLTC